MQQKHSKSRLEAFSDSVFAFAATLLVVSLEVPESVAQLKDLQLGFISFGLSFFALALLWKVHYNLFRRTNGIDNVFITLNMILLFVILFYVYPLKFLANSSIGKSVMRSPEELSFVFQLYSIGFILIFAIVAAMYEYSIRFAKNAVTATYLKMYSRHFLIFVVVGFISIFTAKMMIGLRVGFPGLIYILIGPLCHWHSKRYSSEITEENIFEKET